MWRREPAAGMERGMEQGMNGASSARGHGRGRRWLGAAPRELLRAKSCPGAQVRMQMSHPDVSELLLAAFSRESPHGHAAAPAVSPAGRVWGAPAALSVRCQLRVVPWGSHCLGKAQSGKKPKVWI